MGSPKCVDCQKKINIDFFKEYEIDDKGGFWCIPCTKKESNKGIYINTTHDE